MINFGGFAVNSPLVRWGILAVAVLTVSVVGYVNYLSANQPFNKLIFTAQGCTVFTSPNGAGAGAGATEGAPITLILAFSQAVAGQVICLEPGVYFNPTGGAGSGQFHITSKIGTGVSPIVVRPMTDGATLSCAQTTPDNSGCIQVAGSQWITIEGLVLTGDNLSNTATAGPGGVGLRCQKTGGGVGAVHVTFSYNTIFDFGMGGIIDTNCDYEQYDHNLIWHTGYANPTTSQGSGISLNTEDITLADGTDAVNTFHAVVADNVVGGNSTSNGNPTDGNGIIMDSRSSAIVPNNFPDLVIGNVVYNNGGRCITTTNTAGGGTFRDAFHWFVNNSCYKDGLNHTLSKSWPEINFQNCIATCFALNNAVYGTGASGGGTRDCYAADVATGVNAVFAGDYMYADGVCTTSGLVAGQLAGITNANPLYLDVPFIVNANDLQQFSAPNAATISTEFLPQSSSPLLGAGVNPLSDAYTESSTATLVTIMQQWLSVDMTGKVRNTLTPDIGALQVAR